MPRGAAPRALLGLIALVLAIAVAAMPAVDLRAKDKNGGKRDKVAAETVDGDSGQTDVAYEAPPDETSTQKDSGGDVTNVEEPAVEQPLTATKGNASSDDRTLLALDADGDYLPDALDNCPGVQNPDQSDADGDGHGDACPVYQDMDGDSVADKQDNCPNIATSDFSDRDGDGVGDACDKSPDGIEPEPKPIPELDGQGGEAATELTPENGEGLDGQELERASRSRSKERQRTDVSKPIITSGADEGVGSDAQILDERLLDPERDNPRRNEELIAEAAASGDLYAPPQPPPAPQRAWEEGSDVVSWEPVIRIDAGATNDQVTQGPADAEAKDSGQRPAADKGDGERNRASEDVGDSRFARGWMRAKLFLQDEGDTGADPGDGSADGGSDAGSAPVPVESGLVITGVAEEDPPRDEERARVISEPAGEDAPLESTANAASHGREKSSNKGENHNSTKDGSRRDGSSRGPAAPSGPRGNAQSERDAENQDQGRKSSRDKGTPAGWGGDRYFEGGSALNWTGDLGVAGTDDDELYLTQRSGSGPGKKRGFAYAIPIENEGTYLVRLYFAEPYWGSPGGPDGETGRRVFTVAAEGENIIEDLDVYEEVGSLTALVKQVEVEITDGELNLRFTAREGEPIVAAIEILQPAG